MKNKYAVPLAVLLVILLGLIGGINEIMVENKKKEIKERYLSGYYDNIIITKHSYNTKDWDTYIMHGVFSIKVPPSMEVKDSNHIHSQDEYDIIYKRRRIKNMPIIFTQKGLATKDSSAFNTYCRIIITIEQGQKGDFFKSNEKEELSIEDIHYIQNSVNTGKYKLLGNPEVRWIKIENIYALNIEYDREGMYNYHTKVNTYLLFNDSQSITLTLSYRREDENLWKKDFEAILSTFQWNNWNE